jgi:regulator of protease activity HflC (stomatin/prohibitin superfamily)
MRFPSSTPPPFQDSAAKERRAMIVKSFGKSFILFLVAALLIIITLLFTVRFEQVTGSEVAIKVSNLTGDFQVIAEPGTTAYIGLFNTFHIIDASVQRLEMTVDPSRGDRAGKDDLRIKTVDGSDVNLDLTINYALRRDMIEEVVKTSGLGDMYKVKWVRDYSRSVCRANFGELTTEEFYNASKRKEKALQAKDKLNELLNDFGIEVTQVIAEKFRFHEKYEAKIKAKKLADQEVEEQISKAGAAMKNQEFRTVQATKQKEVAIKTYEGEMQEIIVGAKAEAEKATQNAEAFKVKTQLGGDAQFYEKEKNAQAITIQKKMEAEALKKMADALVGEGGRNIVKMKYADQLKHMPITGEPFTMQSQTERFSHTEENAATRRRPDAPAGQ